MSEYKATEADRAQVERDPMNSMELATLSDLRDFVMPARLIARVLAERRVFKAKVDEAALAEVSLRADRDRLARDAGISRGLLNASVLVIESFRPLVHAVKAIVDDGWPTLASNAHLSASLEARLLTLKAAYEGVADMVADADAEASVSSGKAE